MSDTEFSFADLLKQAGTISAESTGGGDFGPEEPPAPGKYLAEVKYAAHTTSSKSGKHGLNYKVTVVEDSTEVRHSIWRTEWLSPESDKAVNLFFRSMLVLGYSTEWFAEWGTDVPGALEKIASELPGTRLVITVKKTDKNQAGVELAFIDLPSDAPEPKKGGGVGKAVAGARPVVRRSPAAAPKVTPPGAAV